MAEARPQAPVLTASPGCDSSPAGVEQESVQETSFRDNFRHIRELGQGAQGKALLVQHKSTGNKYVLKQIPLSRLPNRRADPALSEVEVLSRLSHQNITRLNGAWRTRESINILMEYADGGSLADVINARKESRNLLDEDVLLDWFVQIVGALRAMHEEHILHRDLKAANVFLTARNIIKVGHPTPTPYPPYPTTQPDPPYLTPNPTPPHLGPDPLHTPERVSSLRVTFSWWTRPPRPHPARPFPPNPPLSPLTTNLEVGDFGISKVLDSAAELAQTAVGTPYYLAPEVAPPYPYPHPYPHP